jgi:hypothetical protein
MATLNLNPSLHPVFNELDSHGLLLGLPRLKGEKNAEYKQRLMDVMVHRGGSSYQGLIHAITRELGLKITDAISITPVLDGNNIPLVAFPAVEFIETKCFLYENYITGEVLLEIDRFDVAGGSFALQGLVNTINATGKYTAVLKGNPQMRSMCIYHQSSIGEVTTEEISNSGAVIRLAHTNLVSGTIAIESPNLVVRKSSSYNLQDGEYYIDEESGTLTSAQVPAAGSIIRYKYRIDDFVAQASPVIIHNLQSADFKTKMFETVTDENGDSQLGLPTRLGSDIINELLSVYPSNWGR